ncbi:MAG: 6-carboxytetrahydropterin synthase [Bacteriovorax sp.]|nr:6-carboxytetrahydropterin synthase [Bacteriovorax sp.]
MSTAYSIRVYKQYFNFASSHFMLFKNGTREPLHGHNYRVQVKGNALDLDDDMVFDFLDIKPIVRDICDSLDHKLLIPKNNPQLHIEEREKNYILSTRDESFFSIPQTDVLILPIENTSAERIAAYIAFQIRDKVLEKFKFEFKELEIEVEETPGQSAVFVLTKD